MSLITIVQGEDRTLTFTLQEVDANGVTTYMDLTGVTEIEVRAAAAAGGYISFKKSATKVAVLDTLGGVFKVTISDTESALLKVAPDQNLEVIVDIGTTRRIAQLLKSITVIRRLFV
jgi:hypothetical protein